jgi:hypothetical protein
LKLKLAVPATIVALGLIAAASPAHAVTVKQIRKADFVAQLSETRATGHYDFLAEGVHVWTEGATSTDKVAEYWAIGTPLPTTGGLEWFGTTNQPGAQAVVDLDNDGTVDGILVGEATYQGRWWANNTLNTWLATHSNPNTPGPNDGYDHSGSLAAWKTAYPNARLVAGGFSLGSGLKGDGVLRSVTFGETSYVFTDTPAVVTKDVTGTVTSKVKKNLKAKVTLTAAALPAGTTQGKALSWKITVDGKKVVAFEQNAGTTSTFAWTFKKHTGTHKIVVSKNGVKDTTVKVKTNKA